MKNHLFTLLILLLVIGCKSEENEEPTLNPEELIVGKWQAASITVDQQADNQADNSPYLFFFNQDKSYFFENPEYEQQGIWEFIDNATALILDKDTNLERRVKVLELTETSLHLEFMEPNGKTGTPVVVYELIPCPGDCLFTE